MNLAQQLTHWICILALMFGQFSAVEVQACDMDDMAVAQAMDMADHDMHAMMSEHEPQTAKDVCCDDCSCVFSTCHNQFNLLASSDYALFKPSGLYSIDHASLSFKHIPESPLRPPII